MKKHYNFKTLAQGVKSLVAILMVTLMAAGNVFAQTSVTFVFGDQGYSDAQAITSGNIDNNISFTTAQGNSSTAGPKYYNSGSSLRFYYSADGQGNEMTLTPAAGYAITGLEITTASGSYNPTVKYVVDNGTAEEATYSNLVYTIANVNATSSLKFYNANTTSKQLRATQIKVYYSTAAPAALLPPTFTVASGTYFAAQTVTLEGPAGATIYYTVDGTTPDATSTEYTAPIAVNATATIKAIAVLGAETSSVATATYTIRIPVEVANIAAFKAAAGTDIYKITGPVTVVGQYSNKYYTFVQDNTGSLYIYGTMANAYEPGDVISDGVYGTYDLYNGLNEMKPVSGLPTGQGLAGTPVQPVVATLADIVANYADYEAKLVTVNGVTIAADKTFGTSSATRGVNISQGDATAQIYNTMGTITGKQVYANDVVNVTGYVIRYNTTIEIVPRSQADIVSLVASLPYNVNFDSNVDDGIVLNNGTATNQWFIGQASGFDNNKLFITSNNGATNKYDNEASLVKASRTLRIPASGATLMFDYRVNGNSNDCLVVSVVKNNTETVLATFFGSNDWNSASLTIDPAFAGDVDLVFTWRNDASVDNQFPAAIDNISIVEATCVQPTALNTTVNGTTAVVTWTAPADQTAWTVEYKYADHSEWHSMNASTTSVTLAGLDGNTTYDVRVKANCGATSSAWTTGQFTIDCQNSIQASIDRTIGDGSTTNSYLPFYGTYNYSYSQQIYDAAELNIPAGPITEISFYCTTAPTSTTTGNIRIWMANTTKSTFADNTDYIDPSTLTQVAYVEGNRPFTTGWNTFTLSQPFMYDGTSNLVVAYYEGYDTWNGGSFWAQSTTDNKSIAHYSDTYSAVSYTSPATATGSKYYNKYRSDIKLVGSGLVCNDQPTCVEPTDVTVSDVTNYTANLAWTPGDSTQVSWTVEYKADNAADWTAVNVASTTYNMVSLAPNTHYQVRVKANCTATSFSEYAVADFTTFSACMEPTDLVVAAVNGVNVDLSWTPRGTETEWLVEYKKVSENTWTPVSVSNVAWVTLSGLSPLSDYNVRVKSVCGNNNESNWITANFTTGCVPSTLPYAEGFEDYATSSADFDCWSFINNHTSASGLYPMAYVNNSSTYVHSGSKSLYFRSGASQSVYAIMPAFTENSVTLSFWYRNEGTGTYNGTLSVGYMNNAADENSFVLVQTFPQVTTLTNEEVNFTNLNGKRIAFRYTGGTSNNYYLGIDDINVSQVSFCLNPNDVTVSNVSGSSADLTWTPRGDGSTWEVAYGPVGFNPASGTSVTTTTPSITLSGLTPRTSYDVYVRSLCSQTQSDWSDVVSFTTPCSSTCGFVFALEDSYGDGWNGASLTVMQFGNAVNTLTVDDEINTATVTLCDNEPFSLIWNSGSYDSEASFTLTDPFGTTLYSCADGSALSDGATIYSGMASCTPVTCHAPSGLVASNITDNSVDLTWTAGVSSLSDSYIVEYGPTGFAPGTGTTVTTTSTSVTLTGLTGGVTYDARVRKDCGLGDVSFWSAPVSFTTTVSVDCANPVDVTIGDGTSAANTIPFNTYYKNSRNETIYPSSEFSGPCQITGISYYSNATASLTASNVKIYLATRADDIFNSTSDWTPTGDLTLVYDANNVTLGGETGWQTFTFDVPYFYSGNGNLVVCVTKTAASYNSSVQYRYTSVTNTCLYKQNDSSPYNELSNTAAGTRSANRANAKFVTCPVQITCPSPVVSPNLTVTTHTATVQWTPGGSETQWEVSYTLNGNTTTLTTTQTSLTINNLDAATQYSIPFSITALCSADDQSFPVNRTLTFTTDCEIFTLPYTENFDSYTTTSTSFSTSIMPTCWERDFTGTSTSYGAGIYYSSSLAHSDARSLRLYNYIPTPTSTSASYGSLYAVLPELDADLDVVAITFQARRGSTTSYHSIFQVGVVTDVNNMDGTFTPIDTIIPSGTTYEPFTVSLEGFHTGRIAFRMTKERETGKTAYYNYAYIDDIEVYQAVFTRDLNLVNVESIDDNCDLSNVPVTFTVQNDNATADVASFTASYSINGGTPVTETFTPTALASGQQATFTFSQLATFTDAVNSITVTLAYSGDGNPANDVITLNNINLIAPANLPYFEDFTNVTMGQGGWTAAARNANPVMWTVENGTPTYTYSDEFNASSYMVSPCLNIPAGQYVISYDYNALGVLPENMTVYMATSPAPADWTVINQHQNFTHTAIDNHVDYIFNNDASGVYYIVVKAASVRGSVGMTFDNLNIAPAVNVTVNTGANGTSIPNGTVTVASGSDYTVHFLPNAGYHVASISVDGVQVMGEDNSNGNVYDYTLHNVTANTTVYATFTASNVIVSKYVNTNTPFGQFVPAAPETLPYGGNTTLTFNVNPHYHLSSLLVSNYEYNGSNTLAGAVDVLPNATRTGDTYTYDLTNVYHNTSVLATVRIDTVGLFYTVYGHGVIENQYVTDANSPVPAHFGRYVDYGSTIMATIVPAIGYHVESVTINGVNYGAIEAYQFANISEQQNVEVVFAPNTYTITTNGYGPGMVTPGATFIYDPANTYYFAATPVTGYRIASVLRNNVPLTIADPEATFRDTLTNILDNYHYEVSFNPMDYNVTATCGANGQIAPMGVNTYHYNNQGVYTIMANTGYYISSVTIDGNTTNYTQADALTTYTYTFNFTGANAVDHSISATFAPYQYTVTVTTPTHGTITPGTTTYNYGQSPVFAITPAAGYGIVNVMVDGVNVGAVTSYQFPALTADHTLSATFAQYQYVITATAGNGGTISPVGATNMVSGGNQTYTITPATGYHITDVFVDGASVGAVGTYTFSNVTANHTIFAAFDVNEYTITVTQPANGAITPGTTTVTYGATPTFVVTPNTGYSVTAITLNGSNVMSQAQNTNGVYTYTLPAVSANATLTATMTQKTFTITKNAGNNGAINGPATANYGATASYTIVPNAGYVVDNVVVDGMNMGAITSYTFVNVVANHTIAATFRLEDCVIPTNMHTTDITTTSATFSWYHPTATSFEVQYKPILGTTFNTVTVNADNYTVTTLQPGTTYVWMVRANCGNNNYSAWSNGQSFRTNDEIPDGIEDHTAQELINVYASHSDIHIVNEYGVQIDNVEVYDVYGKLLYSGHVTSSNEVISMNVAVGTYVVRLITDKGNATYKLYLTK